MLKNVIVTSNLTNAICGEFNSLNEAQAWVQDYVTAQNAGLDLEDERNIYAHDFSYYVKSR